ncbi:hypothetical protein E2C01_087283 [Portunus trituberculatus]|uniref:Uncharacterized protein n=1 Tax=Portunus trituberculatus TaxID=210409 RepID=A0A5B7JFR7_PORTR|nr:hypothetical protein [Portunus trituberculatus]
MTRVTIIPFIFHSYCDILNWTPFSSSSSSFSSSSSSLLRFPRYPKCKGAMSRMLPVNLERYMRGRDLAHMPELLTGGKGGAEEGLRTPGKVRGGK